MADANQQPIRTTAELVAAVRALSEMRLLAVDTETTGLDPFQDEILLLQIGNDRAQYVIDCRALDLAPLVPILSGPVPKVLHNAKFDYKFLAARKGIRLENVIDTMLLEAILANGLERGRFSLATLAERYLGEVLAKGERFTFEGHTGEFTRAQLDYARRDVAVTYRVLLAQMPRIRKEGLAQTAKLECLAACAFGDIELAGIHLDAARWREVLRGAEARRDEIREKLDAVFAPHADRDLFGGLLLNYDSEEQVRAALAKAGLALPDTAESTLRETGHPAALTLLAYREQQKILTTYGESFLQHIHPRTGRIHPTFEQLGAESGRVSCRDPNLQNILTGSEFRECFSAPPGRKIITADYSGIELRILAEASQDPVFLKTFREGGDLHSIVARAVFGVPVDKHTNPELRRTAKAINFGLAYGMGAQGLAAQIGRDVDQAQTLMDRYFANYARIRTYLEESADRALALGYATTFLGRRRYFQIPEDRDSPEGRRQVARIRRQAKNTPIQGTSADMTKLALVWLRERITRNGFSAQVVNTVHDEIVVECAEGESAAVAELVKRAMIEAGEKFLPSVPVEVDVTLADHWAK